MKVEVNIKDLIFVLNYLNERIEEKSKNECNFIIKTFLEQNKLIERKHKHEKNKIKKMG